jgi:hypothetical protein
VKLVVMLRVLFFHANQSLLAWVQRGGVPVTGPGFGDETSTTYKIG